MTIHRIQENGLQLCFQITDDHDLRLLYFGCLESETDWLHRSDHIMAKQRMVELHLSGENHADHHGSKHTGTLPGKRLRLKHWDDRRNAIGCKLVFHLWDEASQVAVRLHWQFYDGVPVARVWSEVDNCSSVDIGIEYLSSFAYTGLDQEGILPWDQKMNLHIPHNTWYGEAQWSAYSLPELGLRKVNEFSMKRLAYSSTGTWSSSQYAPMGYLENLENGCGLVWQIEHHGSWQWEISDMADRLYLQLSGPTESEHHWWKKLAPGQTFQSVPVAVGAVRGGLEKACAIMNTYRRMIRRPNADNVELPVIFNDYMNCLFGDPTTEKLIPLIDAASEAGCEIFCIDCGWYSDGYWWDGVGEWLPSAERFPNGLTEVLDYIRSKGMVAGLWLELEVMGVKCKKAAEVPNDWFFVRHGRRVIDHSRYQLDYRNPQVREYADQVIHRLVQEYGVGYIKMDYNINAGIGTELAADSFGDGLLEHNRAYLGWLDGVFERYPDLVIENCGSGGMRLDYAMLSRHSIQSSSDQTDCRLNAAIAAASASLVTPEQCAIWSYPLREGDDEEVILNMVNALLLRIHQSGHLAEINPERFELIQQGIDYYKRIRKHIRVGTPVWPLGIPTIGSPWMSFGIRDGGKLLLAVWRMDGGDTVWIPIPLHPFEQVQVKMAYPQRRDCYWEWDANSSQLAVQLPKQYSARIFELTIEKGR